MPCSVVSSRPSSRYWPGCTSAIPTRARKGARIVFREMIARVRAICASATSRSARVRSSSVAGTMPCWRRLSARPRFASASCAWASSARSSASSTETSSATSNVPASTTSPGSSRTWTTRPGTLVAQRDRARSKHRADRRGRPAILELPRHRRCHCFDRLGLARRGRLRLTQRCMLRNREKDPGSRDQHHQERRSHPDASTHVALPKLCGDTGSYEETRRMCPSRQGVGVSPIRCPLSRQGLGGL